MVAKISIIIYIRVCSVIALSRSIPWKNIIFTPMIFNPDKMSWRRGVLLFPCQVWGLTWWSEILTSHLGIIVPASRIIFVNSMLLSL